MAGVIYCQKCKNKVLLGLFSIKNAELWYFWGFIFFENMVISYIVGKDKIRYC